MIDFCYIYCVDVCIILHVQIFLDLIEEVDAIIDKSVSSVDPPLCVCLCTAVYCIGYNCGGRDTGKGMLILY